MGFGVRFCSRSFLYGGDFLPNLESLLSFRSVLSSRELMPFRPERRSHQIVYFEKALRLFRRFKSSHTAFP